MFALECCCCWKLYSSAYISDSPLTGCAAFLKVPRDTVPRVLKYKLLHTYVLHDRGTALNRLPKVAKEKKTFPIVLIV